MGRSGIVVEMAHAGFSVVKIIEWFNLKIMSRLSLSIKAIVCHPIFALSL